MDRVLVYPGQIPLETDILSTNKYGMVGLSKLAAAVFGTSTLLNAFTCIPTGPASLQVQVTAGEMYSLQNIDGTAYSSLAADTTHQIMKQGILLDTVTLSAPAPGTGGQSINYLVQVAYSDSDALPVVLPYYNASNPSQAYSGPNNAGTTNNTVRKGLATVSIKAGVAATTGSQVTPAPDAGNTGMFVVTVANGQTTIIAGNISTLAGAPFITETLTQKISQAFADARYLTQSSSQITAVAGGTADALTATFTPAITAISNQTVLVRAASANQTTTPTFAPNAVAAMTIVKGNNLLLAPGDIAGAGHWLELTLDATLGKAVLQNPATGIAPASSGKNRIINGAITIDQRNAGASQTFTAAAALAYCVDQFYGYCTGANVTGQQVAGPVGYRKGYQFTGAASNTAVGFGQRIEAANIGDLAGSTATLSAVLSSSSLTILTWTAYYANTADSFGSLASPTRTQIATGTFTITNTPTRYNAQIALPANAANGVEIVFTGGALLATQTLSFTGLQLESGSYLTPFEIRQYAQESMLCKRYYEKSYEDSVVPGTVTNTGAIIFQAQIGGTNSANNSTASSAHFVVTKRVIPTVTIYNPSTGASNSVQTATSNVAPTLVSSTSNVRVSTTDTGSTNISSQNYHFVADATL